MLLQRRDDGKCRPLGASQGGGDVRTSRTFWRVLVSITCCCSADASASHTVAFSSVSVTRCGSYGASACTARWTPWRSAVCTAGARLDSRRLGVGALCPDEPSRLAL